MVVVRPQLLVGSSATAASSTMLPCSLHAFLATNTCCVHVCLRTHVSVCLCLPCARAHTHARGALCCRTPLRTRPGCCQLDASLNLTLCDHCLLKSCPCKTAVTPPNLQWPLSRDSAGAVVTAVGAGGAARVAAVSQQRFTALGRSSSHKQNQRS